MSQAMIFHLQAADRMEQATRRPKQGLIKRQRISWAFHSSGKKALKASVGSSVMSELPAATQSLEGLQTLLKRAGTQAGTISLNTAAHTDDNIHRSSSK